MFSSGPNYSKLKTNLRLAINRLKLLEKKKTELALKARKEIADYIGDGKMERAKIRVEHIIREDYLVEAYELVEMFADLLLARFGLLQQMKDPDEGLKESISSLIWIAPRIQADVGELKIIGDALIAKYGKAYGLACHDNSVGTVSPKLMQKMSVQAPPKILVERYLMEIAKMYNVNYEPDHKVFEEDDSMLIDMGMGGLGNPNDLGAPGGGSGGASGGGGGGGMTLPPLPAGAAAAQPPGPGFHGMGYPNPYMQMPIPAQPPGNPPAYQPFNYPNPHQIPDEEKYPLSHSHSPPPKFDPGFNIPPNHHEDYTKELNFNFKDNGQPKPAPRGKGGNGNGGGGGGGPGLPDLSSLDLPDLDLPSVPSGDLNNSASNGRFPNTGGTDENDIDFDDLTKRFEDLKKKK